MIDSSNPLFTSERELLERQKEEYKNALMGDVEQIKTQSQEVGKKVAIAGGVLVAGLLLRRMFSGGGKKKPKKIKGNHTPEPYPLYVAPADAPIPAGYTTTPTTQQFYAATEQGHPTPPPPQQTSAVSKTFLNSELMQMLTQQVVTLLLVYLTKKVEEYLSSVSENSDIATKPIEVTEVVTTEYIYPEEDAL